MFSSLFAALIIAGAFWFGALAARRLRERDDSPALAGSGPQRALNAAPSQGLVTQKIRSAVAERLHREALALGSGEMEANEDLVQRRGDNVALADLRLGDVVLVEEGDPRCDGDFIVEGILRLREGSQSSFVVNMSDGGRERWLVGGTDEDRWLVVEPQTGHGISGEPPRNIRLATDPNQALYSLERRGQSSVAALGRHGRPPGNRVGTYLYRSDGHERMWVERWGHEIWLGQGREIKRMNVSFLPGS